MGWNMRQFILSLICIFPTSLWATAYTSTQTGDFNSASTWGGGGYPGASDTFTVSPAHTVTVSTDTALITSGVVTGHASTPGTLVVDAKLSIESLTVGNADATTKAVLTSGPNSEIAVGTNLLINAATWNSTSNGSSWAKVTGTGTINVVPSVRRQRYDLSYVSFQTLGVANFASGSTGILANSVVFDHCSFVGNGVIKFGDPTYTESGANVSVSHSDFRDTGHIYFKGAVATTGISNFSNNTLHQSVTKKSLVLDRSNTITAGNVYSNYDIGSTQSSTGSGHSILGSYFTLPTLATTGSSIISRNNNGLGYSIQNNYSYSDYPNAHGIANAGTSGGSGSHDISWNIFENIYNGDGANFIQGSPLPINAHHNMLIGAGNLAVSYATGAELNVYNNTIYIKQNSTADGALFLTETSLSPGPIRLYNNIVYGSTTISRGVNSLVSGTQTITKAGYNSFYNVTAPYYSTGVNLLSFTVDNRANDNSYNPIFKDETRTLATWGRLVHGTDGTVGGANAKLLAINGYNASTKTQSDEPSGAVIYGTDSALVNWVRAGFVPTNPALKTAGEEGAYIGAMDVVSLGNPAALLMVP